MWSRTSPARSAVTSSTLQPASPDALALHRTAQHRALWESGPWFAGCGGACLLLLTRSAPLLLPRRRLAGGELVEDLDGGLMDQTMLLAPLDLDRRLLSLSERHRRRLVLKVLPVTPVGRHIEAAGDVHSGPADDVVERKPEAGHVAVVSLGADPGSQRRTRHKPDGRRPFNWGPPTKMRRVLTRWRRFSSRAWRLPVPSPTAEAASPAAEATGIDSRTSPTPVPEAARRQDAAGEPSRTPWWPVLARRTAHLLGPIGGGHPSPSVSRRTARAARAATTRGAPSTVRPAPWWTPVGPGPAICGVEDEVPFICLSDRIALTHPALDKRVRWWPNARLAPGNAGGQFLWEGYVGQSSVSDHACTSDP